MDNMSIYLPMIHMFITFIFDKCITSLGNNNLCFISGEGVQSYCFTSDLKVDIFEKISIKSTKIRSFSVKIMTFSMKISSVQVVRENENFSRKM